MLMLMLPFPYIATTAGWITAEVGRQPWLIYGLMRTPAGVSPHVSAGNALFTLIGFMGMYTVLAILFLFLVYREIEEGPEPAARALRIAMETIWFCLVAVMIAVYVVLDGFDLGAGIVHLLVARTDARAARGAALHRPGVGRQRSLAAGRRRHALLRLSRALCLQLQRLLSAADDGAVAADPARHLHRVPQSHRQPGVAAVLGRGLRAAPARCWRSSSARRWATWCAACRSTAPAISSCRCGPISPPAATPASWIGTPSWSRSPRSLTLTVHGALWVALKTDGELEQRARRRSPHVGWWALLAGGGRHHAGQFPRAAALCKQSFAARPWGYVFPLLALAGLIGMRLMNSRRPGLRRLSLLLRCSSWGC